MGSFTCFARVYHRSKTTYGIYRAWSQMEVVLTFFVFSPCSTHAALRLFLIFLIFFKSHVFTLSAAGTLRSHRQREIQYMSDCAHLVDTSHSCEMPTTTISTKLCGPGIITARC